MSLSLRNRFLLAMLVGAVLPLGIVGFWLTRSVQNSAGDLVRARLQQSLDEVALGIGRAWASERSALFDIAEAAWIRDRLAAPASAATIGTAAVTREAVRSLWQSATHLALSAEVRDLDGNVVLRLPADLGLPAPRLGEDRSFPVVLPVLTPFIGEPIGTIGIRVRLSALLPASFIPGGVGGSILAVIDPASGELVGPMAIDVETLSQPSFTWQGEEWLAVEGETLQPPLRLVMAGPTAPLTQPFERVSRQGTVALLAAVAFAFLVATVAGRRLTSTLENLAASAAAVSRGDLSQRAAEVGPPEVQATARAFNAMSGSLEDTLQRLSAQESAAAVGEFAASLAHEVRNPLTAVRMDLQRAGRHVADQPAQAEKLVERALAEVDRLNESVTGFLDLARAGRPRGQRIDLREPVAAAIRAAQPKFAATGTALRYDEPEAPVWVEADFGGIEQIFLNLLLNAAEAMQAGQEASIDIEADDERVIVIVSDPGQGIAAADRERIFEPFVSTKAEGAGLGLAVARRIARAHRGDLTVTSEQEGGSRFRVELPGEGRFDTPGQVDG